MSDEKPTQKNENTLRLLWPQWQGARGDIFATYEAEGSQQGWERGYALGTRVLEAILPLHDGPTASVPSRCGTGAWRRSTASQRRRCSVKSSTPRCASWRSTDPHGS